MLGYALVAGLLYGLYFSLVALGLNLVFGVMRLVNLAHGDFVMLGAFLAWFLASHAHVNPLLAIPIAVAVFVPLGMLLYHAMIPRLLVSRDPEMLSFILFFGLSQVIEAVMVIVFGNDQRTIPERALGQRPVTLFRQTFPASWVMAAVAGLAATAAVAFYLYRTRLGRATRAVMANRDEAMGTGIDADRVSAIALGIGLALAACAGTFAPFMLGTVQPDMGIRLTTVSFAVVVIGALGNPLATVAGGLIYGLGLMLMETYYASWAQALPYFLLVVILLLRPQGLFGRHARAA
ncbi:MAG: branched-chain amino acid ABC transporter permease [Acidiferrobacteraceae bacterium]